MSQTIDLRMGSCSPAAIASGEASFESALIRLFRTRNRQRSLRSRPICFGSGFKNIFTFFIFFLHPLYLIDYIH